MKTTLPPEQWLERFDELQYDLLLECTQSGDIKKWNAYRKKERLAPVLLEGADFTGADLSQADLRRARLIGANLSSTNMTKTILMAAELADANPGHDGLHAKKTFCRRGCVFVFRSASKLLFIHAQKSPNHSYRIGSPDMARGLTATRK